MTANDARAADTRFPRIEPLRPPKAAPATLFVVLLGDVGFAASSAFGGAINTPTAERLAKNGLKFNRFHTTGLGASTRQALLTGRNHHSVDMGNVAELATSAPGNNSMLPNNDASLAKTLKLNGYSTAQFGKCDEFPSGRATQSVLIANGRQAAASNTFTASSVGRQTSGIRLLLGTTAIEAERTPEEGYHFTDDLTEKATSGRASRKRRCQTSRF